MNEKEGIYMSDLVLKDLFVNTSDYANKKITVEGWVKTREFDS